MNAPPTAPPEECPACDEPTEENGWDVELEVCAACAAARREDDAQHDDELHDSWDDEDPDGEDDSEDEFDDAELD